MNKDCIFCKIVSGELPKEFKYEDEEILAFDDITPLSPIHLLIIPRKHIEDFFHADAKTIEKLTHAIKKLIDRQKLMGKGYRLVVNGGGAQDVHHLHFHLRSPMVRGE